MSSSNPLLYLDESTLQSLDITTENVIECMERLILRQSDGEAWCTPKSVIQPGDGRYMMSTLSAAQEPPYLAVKSIVLNPENTARNLPQINGLIILLDSRTGIPAAVLDGNWITAIRTAGACAVVARRLARQDSRTVAFIGAGVQARSHLRLFADMFPLEQVIVYGRGKPNRTALCRDAESRQLRSVDCRDPREAVRDADIIVSSLTMTDEIEPFIDPDWLKSGVFLSSTDCAKPFRSADLGIFTHIVIDDMEQEAAMPDPMVPTDLISGDLSSLVAGRTQGRVDDGERCAFVFRSVAIGDLALSSLAYELARQSRAGLQMA
ncbi:MAG: ornithine cyclodeaminase family protein [Gammaproteobacteria bacterium]|nr:ornithine cyclodeaminase family protein [Gammaproteobacteria bacterium]